MAPPDPFVLFKGKNVNSIRLRVRINPAGGWNNGADVLNEARRAIAQGQRVMIDFHYSATWADPAHQTKPAAWASHSVALLESDIYSHTKGILDYLKANGVTVTCVQVGNEINSGMLWPTGRQGQWHHQLGDAGPVHQPGLCRDQGVVSVGAGDRAPSQRP